MTDKNTKSKDYKEITNENDKLKSSMTDGSDLLVSEKYMEQNTYNKYLENDTNSDSDGTTGWKGIFKKTELLQLSEEIYEREQKIQRLEFDLADEDFHFKHIPNRKNRVKDRLLSHIKYYLFFMPLWLGSLIAFIVTLILFLFYGYTDKAGIVYIIMAGGMLFSGLVLGTTTIPLFKYFFLPDWKDFCILWNSRNTESAKRNARLQQKDSFQVEYEQSKNKIEFLKSEIEKIKAELEQLLENKKLILKQAVQGSDISPEKSDLWNVRNDTAGNGKFSIKSNENELDLVELYEYYQKERMYYQNHLSDIEIRIRNVDKDIIKINDKYENAKKIIALFGVFFVVLIIVQQLFKEMGGFIFAAICLIITSFLAIRVERYCEPAILNHLIEEESERVAEYVFQHNIVSFGRKRQELLYEKKACEDKIELSKKTEREIEELNEKKD